MVAAAIVGGAIVGGVATTMAGNKAADAQKDAARQASGTELQMYNQNREDLAPYRETGYQALGMLSRGLGLPGYSTTPGVSKPLSYEEWAAQNPMPIGDYRGIRGGIQQGVNQAAQRQQYDQYVKNFVLSTNPNGATGTPVGDFNRDFTLADFEKDPGYQFRMDQGQQALERSASARGGLMNGGTLKALSRYGQDYASGEYSNAYNRFNNDRTQRFNRLATIAGVGQTATNTTATLGSNAAQGVAEAQYAAGNARAANAVNTGNAINNTVGSLGQFYLSRQYGAGAGAGPGTQAVNYTGPAYSNYV